MRQDIDRTIEELEHKASQMEGDENTTWVDAASNEYAISREKEKKEVLSSLDGMKSDSEKVEFLDGRLRRCANDIYRHELDIDTAKTIQGMVEGKEIDSMSLDEKPEEQIEMAGRRTKTDGSFYDFLMTLKREIKPKMTPKEDAEFKTKMLEERGSMLNELRDQREKDASYAEDRTIYADTRHNQDLERVAGRVVGVVEDYIRSNRKEITQQNIEITKSKTSASVDEFFKSDLTTEEKTQYLIQQQKSIDTKIKELERKSQQLKDRIEANTEAAKKTSDSKVISDYVDTASSLLDELKQVDRDLTSSKAIRDIYQERQQKLVEDVAKAESKEAFDQSISRLDYQKEQDPMTTMFSVAIKSFENYSRSKDVQQKTYDKTVSTTNNAINKSLEKSGVGQKAGDNTNYGTCAVVLVKDSDKFKAQVLDTTEFAEWKKSGEFKELNDKIDKESSLPLNKRTTSFILLGHRNKQELLDSLRPIVGAAVKFPKEIGDFAPNKETQEALVKKISESATLQNGGNKEQISIGGDYFNQFFKKEESEKQDTTNEETVKEEATPTQEQESTSADFKDEEEAPKKEEVQFDFDKALDFLDLDANVIDEKQKQRLYNDCASDLLTDGSGNAFKLKLVRDPITNAPELHRLDKQNKLDLDQLQKDLDLTLTDDDKQNLLKVGQTDRTFNIKGKEVIIYVDKELNSFCLKNADKVRIPKLIEDQLDERQTEDLKTGKAVHVENLKDKQGQAFNGWILLNPRENEIGLLKKKPAFAVDNDYKKQVLNNNDGARDDDFKYDKDAKVITKQHENNDVVKPVEDELISFTEEERKEQNQSQGHKM